MKYLFLQLELLKKRKKTQLKLTLMDLYVFLRVNGDIISPDLQVQNRQWRTSGPGTGDLSLSLNDSLE